MSGFRLGVVAWVLVALWLLSVVTIWASQLSPSVKMLLLILSGVLLLPLVSAVRRRREERAKPGGVTSNRR